MKVVFLRAGKEDLRHPAAQRRQGRGVGAGPLPHNPCGKGGVRGSRRRISPVQKRVDRSQVVTREGRKPRMAKRQDPHEFYRYEVYSVARMEMKSDSLRVRGR